MTLTTSRKCPQCGNEVTPTARFCAECGSGMTPVGISSTPSPKMAGSPGFGMPPPLAPTVRAEQPTDSTQKTIMGVMIGALVLLSVMVAVLAVMLRHATVASNQPCVTAPAFAPTAPPGAGEAHLPSAASLSPAPGNDTTSGAATAPAGDSVPGYLSFLQGIEQKRVAIMTGQPANGTQPDGTADTLQSLMSQFEARPFPAAFNSFAQEYMGFLQDCAADEGKGPDQMTALSTEADKVDSDLSHLCTAQHVVKPFTIAIAGPAPTAPGTPTTTPSTPTNAPAPSGDAPPSTTSSDNSTPQVPTSNFAATPDQTGVAGQP